METRRPGLRRRSQRLQNNDAATPTTPTPPVQRRPHTSIPSKKRQNGPPPSKPLARPARSRDQKTLTQIDFVTRGNPIPVPDLELDCIEDDVSSPPHRSRKKGNGRKKKIDRNQGNTLTQMDYVARRSWEDNEDDLGEAIEGNDMAHVSGTGDDDDDLERTGTPPRWEAVQNGDTIEAAHASSPERRAKRRRLENATHLSPSPSQMRSSQIHNPQASEGKENEGLKSGSSPDQQLTDTDPVYLLYPTSRQRKSQHVTPKKQLKWEVPSSQSPDSPGFMMITGNSPRSPLKSKSLNSPLARAPRAIEQTPSAAKVAAWNASHNNQKAGGSVPRSSISVKPQSTPQTVEANDETPGTSPMFVNLVEDEADNRSLPQSPLGTKSKSWERPDSADDVYATQNANAPEEATDNVVYETDAESENGFHDAHSHPSEQDLDISPGDLDDTYHGENSGNWPNHSTAVSDASILYYRRPQNTLRDPTASELSGINSERLAELFPPNEQETIGPSLPPYPNIESTPRHHPSTQNATDVSTEFVPISSQRPGREEPQDVPCSSPPEVILVESSQPKDWTTQEKKNSSHSAPKDMFASSQLLPDSLMEPIQGPPPEWMLSEDSIHE